MIATTVKNDDVQRRADNTRVRRINAIRTLEALINELSRPGFKGNATITLSSNDGWIGRGKHTIERFEAE